MLRTQDLPPEELTEVTRIAGELYDREKTQAREHKAALDAATEVGIPPEYMERAAEEYHLRLVEKVRARRRRNRIFAVAAAIIGIGGLGGVWVVTHPNPVAISARAAGQPLVVSLNGAALGKNPETQASLRTENGSVVLRIDQFAPAADGQYFANANINAPQGISGTKSVSFKVSGQGLPNIRLYLENGQTERWRSPAVPVLGGGQTATLLLDQFEHQRRGSAGEKWGVVDRGNIGDPKNLSFKVGEFVNDGSARGEVVISDLSFQ